VTPTVLKLPEWNYSFALDFLTWVALAVVFEILIIAYFFA
jgi:hypothetical protein